MEILNYFKRIRKEEIFVSSLVLFLLVNLGNVLSMLFQFVMGHWLLSVADYGILAVLTSITYIFSIPTLSVQTVISRYTTEFNIKKEHGKIKEMFLYFVKATTIFFLLTFVIYSLIALILAPVLKIDPELLVLTGLFIFGAVVYPVGLGVLQGMKKFSAFGWNNVIFPAVRLIIGVFLVAIGWKVYGAVIAMILSNFVAFALIFPCIREIMASKRIDTGKKMTLFDSKKLSAFFAILIVVLMYSLDVMIARIFFNAETVGQYAALSFIGKIILFGTSSVGLALFPISSERFINGKKTDSLLGKTFVLVSVLCAIALILFAICPRLIISLLYGSRYLGISNLLVIIGLAFSFISLLNVFVLYKVSIEEFNFKHMLALTGFLIMQVILMAIFHETIAQFSMAFMISMAISFIGIFILVRKWKK